jgi:hypothetical protein
MDDVPMTAPVASMIRLAGRRRDLPTWTVPAAAGAAVLGRLPFLGHAPGPDESGYLLVGAQWDGRGASLYGSYWVDRPPLLVTIFRFASLLGGLPALRIIGCLAVLAIVLGCARLARLLGGEAASRWAALAAAGLCLSPRLGGYGVNGELLAAPFTVAGMLAVVSAVRSADRRSALRWSVAAGALAVCSLLIKQNLADVVVFGAVAYTVSWLRRDVARHRFVDLFSAAMGGACATLLVMAAWTLAHGTSLPGVLEAMYPFRLRADRVISAGGRPHATARLHGLVMAAVLCGFAGMALVLVADAVRRRAKTPVVWALLVTIIFAGASVLMGGNYWHHYLVELVAPLSVAVGLVASTRRAARLAITYACVAGVAMWGVALTWPQGSHAQAVGRAVGAVAAPTDTIINVWGSPDVVATSGLSAPYEHLWSLPVKTLDPRLVELDRVLAGRDAPTWLVTRRSVRSWGLETGETQAIIARDYQHVQTICGRRVYLHAGAVRLRPSPPSTCAGSPSVVARLQEIAP